MVARGENVYTVSASPLSTDVTHTIYYILLGNNAETHAGLLHSSNTVTGGHCSVTDNVGMQLSVSFTPTKDVRATLMEKDEEGSVCLSTVGSVHTRRAEAMADIYFVLWSGYGVKNI